MLQARMHVSSCKTAYGRYWLYASHSDCPGNQVARLATLGWSARIISCSRALIAPPIVETSRWHLWTFVNLGTMLRCASKQCPQTHTHTHTRTRSLLICRYWIWLNDKCTITQPVYMSTMPYVYTRTYASTSRHRQCTYVCTTVQQFNVTAANCSPMTHTYVRKHSSTTSYVRTYTNVRDPRAYRTQYILATIYHDI